MKYAYYATFEQDGDGFSVFFPDDEGTLTCADTMEEAIKMAEDALNLTMLDYEIRGIEAPKASKINEIKLESNQTVRLIYADTEEYARKIGKNTEKYEKIGA